VLEASPGLTAVQREHLRTIILSGEDLLGLINNILDLSRLESQSVTLEHIVFNIREIVEGSLDIIATTAHKKDIEVSLISPITSDPPVLVGDGFRVKQILMNLLSNAVKFTSKGGVTVHWRHECTADNRCKVTIDVKDTGIGIPASKMERLFKSFSQVESSTSRSYGGSGLGLVISRNLAELLGGECTAASDYGKGSTFTFTFVADTKETPPPDFIRFPGSK
jgi:signal transduction histidine kinase